MQCDVCKQKKATVFLTQIIKGDMHKVNLCEACAKENDITNPTGFSLAEKLMGMGVAHGEKIETQPQERACPACGMPQTTFRKTGRLGCARCYTTFGEGLDNLLKAMHKDVRHKGKVPAGRRHAIEEAAPAVETTPAPAVPAAPPPQPPPPQKTHHPVKSLEARLGEMRTALDKAVAEENFEEAARLRDEMRRLQETV